jgi:hypothetical protein
VGRQTATQQHKAELQKKKKKSLGGSKVANGKPNKDAKLTEIVRKEVEKGTSPEDIMHMLRPRVFVVEFV